jgi:hypothetical protein
MSVKNRIEMQRSVLFIARVERGSHNTFGTAEKSDKINPSFLCHDT